MKSYYKFYLRNFGSIKGEKITENKIEPNFNFNF